jgi:hypothetical protein
MNSSRERSTTNPGQCTTILNAIKTFMITNMIIESLETLEFKLKAQMELLKTLPFLEFEELLDNIQLEVDSKLMEIQILEQRIWI